MYVTKNNQYHLNLNMHYFIVYTFVIHNVFSGSCTVFSFLHLSE